MSTSSLKCLESTKRKYYLWASINYQARLAILKKLFLIKGIKNTNQRSKLIISKLLLGIINLCFREKIKIGLEVKS